MLQQAGSDQFSYFVGLKDENKIIDAGCACAVSFPSAAQKGRVENGYSLEAHLHEHPGGNQTART